MVKAMTEAGYVGTSAYAKDRVKESKRGKFLDSVSGREYSKQGLLNLIDEWPDNAYMVDELSKVVTLQFVISDQEFRFDLG